MKCWNCGEEASGVCTFCGRAVCKEHVREMPAILAVYVGEERTPKAIAVAGALFCGECRPQPEPIEMPEIY
jgi:hypothetical protein